MPISVICPYCSKTIKVERTAKLVCPECGENFGFAELQKRRLLIDARVESNELAVAQDYFVNTEFLGASEHYKKALAANPNSYAAKYFTELCDIYLHEQGDDYDLMEHVVAMLSSSLDVMSRSNAEVKSKLLFIAAMLAETKILITRRLVSYDDLITVDINAYREKVVHDLEKLSALFKIDAEKIMSFAPEVSAPLVEIVDCAITVCYKAVGTVAIGDEICPPTDAEYKKLSALTNDYCFYAHSLDTNFDANKYSPDFSQNKMLNENVLDRFEKFDEENKVNAKKRLIGNIKEYEDILSDCKKALKFTYYSCYKSMCSRQTERHIDLFIDGLKLVYRLLLPRVVMQDKKIEIRSEKIVDIVDYCDILTRFLVDSCELDESVVQSHHKFYEDLYEIAEMYYLPGFEKISKSFNRLRDTGGETLAVCQAFLYEGACCCAPALQHYVDFAVGKDKARAKLVKLCRLALEDFLLLSDFKVEELEQSNFYRPILKISTALLEENEA